jgi:hypothetical protein
LPSPISQPPSAWAVYACLLGVVGGASFRHSAWKSVAVSLGLAATIGLAAEGYRSLQRRRGRDVLGEREGAPKGR